MRCFGTRISQTQKQKSMVTKQAGKKRGKKGRVKTINLKRETIKDLTGEKERRSREAVALQVAWCRAE